MDVLPTEVFTLFMMLTYNKKHIQISNLMSVKLIVDMSTLFESNSEMKFNSGKTSLNKNIRDFRRNITIMWQANI